MASSWWRHHFDEAYLRLHDPLFPEAESRQQAGALLELLGLPCGSRILDAPCGWGRHANLLAGAGHDVVGADLSGHFLIRAARDGADAPPAGADPARYAAADLRHLPFPDASFDAVVNIYTSLGLFEDEADDLRLLREARRVLRPEGRFLLESMHRDEVMAGYAERDAWTLPDGTEVRVRRRFDPVAGVSHEVLRWRRGADEGLKRHSLRLRTASDVDRLLRAAAFEPVAWYGDWDGSALLRDSERLIVVAARSV